MRMKLLGEGRLTILEGIILKQMTKQQIKVIKEACQVLDRADGHISWGQLPNRFELQKAFKSLKKIIK